MKTSYSFILALIILLASCKGSTSPSPAWVVSTLAGSGTEEHLDGAAADAQFDDPTGVAVDSSGNVYVADYDNHRIRKITPGGEVSTLAGDGTAAHQDDEDNIAATTARFNGPFDVAVDSSGNVYVVDAKSNRVRKITEEENDDGDKVWKVKTIAGGGVGTVQFYWPFGVAVDSSGNVYVADALSHRVRKIKITPGEGQEEDTVAVSTLAGSGAEGYKDGVGTAAEFDRPSGVAVDSSSGNVYVADRNNHRVRKIKITPGEGQEEDTVEVSTIAGSGPTGLTRGGYQDGAADTARFSEPFGVAVDSSGNVYVADTANDRVRKIEITPGEGQEEDTVEVSTIAGSGAEGYKDGVGTAAQFNGPFGVAVDSSGNVYVADRDNHRIRKIEYRVP